MSVAVSGEATEAAEASQPDVCQVRGVHHRYGEHVALAGVDFTARRGEISALLGPNGSGKTTLFRLLCTLLPLQQGEVTIDRLDVAADPLAIRSRIGIVFQSPSLDPKLTVDENVACQGALYGIRGAALTARRNEVLSDLGLTDRRRDLCQTLSGGLKRRVELAKGMLHHPDLLLLDEPSTGLDPSARLALWSSLRQMAGQGMAIVMTTHLLDEAEKADRVSILCEGKMVVEGTPSQLRSEMGSGIVTVVSESVDDVVAIVREEFESDPQVMQNQVRLSSEDPAELVPQLAQRLGDLAISISIGRPSLEDVFIARTGQQFD